MSDLELSQRAEKAIAKWLGIKKKYTNISIVNEKGHDIVCTTKDNSIKKIEVKRDFWIDKYEDDFKSRKATNNICVEIWSNFIYGNPGWINYSDADYIFYLGNENLYILDTTKLKIITDMIVNYGEAKKTEPSLKKGVNKNLAKVQYTAHHNGNFRVRNVLINKNWLEHNGVILKTINRSTSNFNKIAFEFNI